MGSVLLFFVAVAQLLRTLRTGSRDPQFRALLILVAATLLAGTIFYARVEGWSPVDALYFSVVTLATVGYGDLTPKTTAGKLFTIVYIFTGISLLAGFVQQIARARLEQQHERQTRRAANRGKDPAATPGTTAAEAANHDQ